MELSKHFAKTLSQGVERYAEAHVGRILREFYDVVLCSMDSLFYYAAECLCSAQLYALADRLFVPIPWLCVASTAP